MADDSYLQQTLNWLRGSPPTTVNLAAPMAAYPSNQDAEFARRSGFSQGSENQQYLDNEKARILGIRNSALPPPTNIPLPRTDPRRGEFVPVSGSGLRPPDTMKPELSEVVSPPQETNNTMMRAALAANRSPIAALGFDPSKVVLDTKMQQGFFGGAYVPSMDSIYSTINPEDSVVHESTHRGLQKLREQYPQAGKILGGINSPDEETVVRWLMHSQGGDPEGKAGPEDAKQRQFAIDAYKLPYTGYKDSLDQLQEMAIEAMKNRGKRVGPQ